MLGTFLYSRKLIFAPPSHLTALGIGLSLVALGTTLLIEAAPAQASPVRRIYGSSVYRGGAIRRVPGRSVITFPQVYPSYPNYILVQPGIPAQSINNSVLINPTVINSPIRNSTLINPTIIPTPGYYPGYYPGINTLTIQTYSRPEPEVVVDPQYGVRYRRPSEY